MLMLSLDTNLPYIDVIWLGVLFPSFTHLAFRVEYILTSNIIWKLDFFQPGVYF